MAQADYSSTNDRGSTTFGRGLQKFISERLPYNNYTVVDSPLQKIIPINPKAPSLHSFSLLEAHN